MKKTSLLLSQETSIKENTYKKMTILYLMDKENSSRKKEFSKESLITAMLTDSGAFMIDYKKQNTRVFGGMVY